MLPNTRKKKVFIKKKAVHNAVNDRTNNDTDSDSDLEITQKPAFEILPTDADFDPNRPPKDGHDYLQQMAYERSKHAVVKVCRNPPTGAAKDMTSQPAASSVMSKEAMPEAAASSSAPSDAIRSPTKEWKELQTLNFLKTRQDINELRSDHTSLMALRADIELPANGDAEAWVAFCQSNEPTLRVIMCLNQRTLENLLEILCDHLDDNQGNDVLPEQETQPAQGEGKLPIIDFSGQHRWLAYWLYATLACLRLPIEPQVHSSLRNIARHCIRLRGDSPGHGNAEATPYNLFIHLISTAFEQYDLREFL